MALLGIIRRWHLRDKVPLREIAKRLGISRNTVRRYLRSETTEPAYAERQTASAIDPYAHQLAGWLKTEAAKSRKQRRSLKQLHEELVDLGFKGSYDRVAAFARQWREGQTEWVNSARKRTTYVDDAAAWIQKLKADARFSHVAIAGHSEGALIAVLAAPVGGADSVVSIEGASKPADEVLRAQLADKLPANLLEAPLASQTPPLLAGSNSSTPEQLGRR